MNEEFQNRIRYHINQYIFDFGFAPSNDELAANTSSTKSEVENALQALADNHALVLHPGTRKLWVVHPFALDPTLFWVTSGNKQWWGNCTWCSLGIATLTNSDTKIFTKLNGEQHPLVIEVKDRTIVDPDYLVHFPIPAKRTWDNVIHFCANTLTFKSEADIDSWCKRHGTLKGEVVPIIQVWELAKLWYGYYLHPDWKRKTPEFAQEIFTSVGLTSDFWQLK